MTTTSSIRQRALGVLVVLAALITPTVGASAAAAAVAFSDVPESHPFAEDIAWLVDEGITTGFPDGTFRPASPVSRQAMAAFLQRFAAPAATPGCDDTAFTDVGATHPFCEEITWLVDEGITTGFPDGTFRPASPVSRQAMAAFLQRFAAPAATPGCDDTAFTDVGATHPFCEEITWLVETGITTGFPDGTFRPANPVSRQAMAAFLHRLADWLATQDPDLPPDPATIAPPVDPTVAATVCSLTSFLYQGADPVQEGVTPDTIDCDQAAAVRGRVVDTAGEPVAGVDVTILDAPEYGATRTRADGRWDLVVNGDGHPVADFRAEGYLPVQRELPVVPDSWTELDDVVLTQLDGTMTEIEADAADPQVHRASTASDADGERTATLLFPAGTGATMVMPDGSETPLSTLSVRATEYTVGERGPLAMPGDLPPGTDYTYAVELSVDEAIAAGATRVDFDQPVIDYTDNFIGFPAGTAVPSATYDRSSGAWIAVPDGIVVDVVDESGGLADLDLTGDGDADGDPLLTEWGIDDAERAVLADLYDPGDSLWRVRVEHFSSYDHNWDTSCAATTPCSGPDGGPRQRPDRNCTQDGSIISCHDQALGERVAVVGTDAALVYQSSRTEGYAQNRRVTIPVSGSSVSPDLVRIEVDILVAGRTEHQVFPPAPDQQLEYEWDGLDAYGRPLPSIVEGRVDVSYVYDAAYGFDPATSPSSIQFASPGRGFAGSFDRDTNEFTTTGIFPVTFDASDVLGQGLGGWSLDVHHRLDAAAGKLIRGDGVTQDARGLLRYTMVPVAGDGTPCDGGSCGDGGPADQAQIGGATELAVDPDGVLHWFDPVTASVRRVTPDGNVETVLGTGTPCLDSPATGCGTTLASGGAPRATSAVSFTGQMVAMTFGPDGSLYVAETPAFIEEGGASASRASVPFESAIVRRIAPDGTATVVAGSGAWCEQTGPGDCGDNGPGPDAGMGYVQDIAVTPDGMLYIADGAAIRRVDADGRLVHAYGCSDAFCSDAVADPAGDASWAGMFPAVLNAAPDGSLIMIDGGAGLNPQAIRRIDPSGAITTIAGLGGNQCQTLDACRDGDLAINASFNSWLGLAVAPDGAVIVPDFLKVDPDLPAGSVLRRFVPGGIVERVGGSGSPCAESYVPGGCGDGGPATSASFNATFRGITTGPDGTIYVYDGDGQSIRALVPDPLVLVPSTDGTEIYRFDDEGRHVATHDALTGAVRWSFGYDGRGRLASMDDGDGNTTTIERDGSGNPTAIVSPYGQRTALTVDAQGWLATVTDPASAVTAMTTSPTGLLASFTRPGGGTSTFTYDADGFLVKDQDAVGGSTTLAYEDVYSTEDPTRIAGYRITATSEQGRVTAYEVTRDEDSEDVRRVRIDPSGARTETLVGAGSREVVTTYPDGGRIIARYAPDPRWGPGLAFATRLEVDQPNPAPDGVQLLDRTVTLDPDDGLRLLGMEETIERNGVQSTVTWDGTTNTRTWTSAEGRIRTETYDDRGRVASMQLDGVDPVTFTYDGRGRRTSVTQGDRTSTSAYDAFGRVATATDPEGAVTTYQYDAAGRRTGLTRPTGATWTIGYDANGNEVSYTLPEGSTFGQGFDPVDQRTSATDPGLGGAGWTWSVDGDLVERTIGTGDDIARSIDAGGRFTGETAPDAATSVTYVGASNRLDTGTWDGGSNPDQVLDFDYAGRLVTRITQTGIAAGMFGITWDADGQVASADLTSGADALPLAIDHDDDGWITSMGPFLLGRGGPQGAIDSIGDGTGALAQTWDSHADLGDRSLEVGGSPVFDLALTRDRRGRITEEVVTTPSGTTTTAYGYDADGRLTSVTVDGGDPDVYEYDGDGNRTSGPDGPTTYDDAGRIVTAAGVNHTYDAGGRLTARGGLALTTNARNETTAAAVDGEDITYTYDVLGRRTSRTDDEGTIAYLYGNPANPVQVSAVRDRSGVLTRYLYDDAGHLFALLRAGATYYVGTDTRGTPRIVADSSGTVVKEVTVDAWGQVLADSDPSFELGIGFGGGIPDPDTGLVRFWMRDYDPTTGRFTSLDPARFDGGLNLFDYAAGDPVGNTDPTGLFCIGGSLYEGLGGGAEACADATGASFCIEAGVGLGVGVSAGMGSPSKSGVGAGTELSAECGGVGGGVGAELFYDECGFQGDACTTGAALAITAKFCASGGTPQIGFGLPVDVASCGSGGKAYVKACAGT